MLVDVPKDVQQQLAVPDWDAPMAIPGYMSRLPQPPKTQQLQRVVDALHQVHPFKPLSLAYSACRRHTAANINSAAAVRLGSRASGKPC